MGYSYICTWNSCYFHFFQQFVAMITFSLVAGFMVNTTVDFRCFNANETLRAYTLSASYPFRHFEQRFSTGGNISTSTRTIQDGGVPRTAEFFVAWGVLTLFYCIIALLVYMLVTANERWEKTFDIIVVLVSSMIAKQCMLGVI